MKLAAALLACLLAGCTQLLGHIPSLQHCEYVSYERTGNHIELVATCTQTP